MCTQSGVNYTHYEESKPVAFVITYNFNKCSPKIAYLHVPGLSCTSCMIRLSGWFCLKEYQYFTTFRLVVFTYK